MESLKDRVAIVGVGETEYSRDSGRSELKLAIEAVGKAAADAGLRLDLIDGIGKFAVDDPAISEVAAGLGIRYVDYYDELGPFGGAACGLVGHAALALAAGMAHYVAVFRALNSRSGSRYGAGAVTTRRGQGDAAFSEPYGLLAPGQFAALSARRHMHQYGTKSEHYGAVAVALRKHACMNPRAVMYGRPLSMQDYMDSRVVHDPLRLPDLCLETDGACAVILTTSERAADLKQRPVSITAMAQVLQGGSTMGRESAETLATHLGSTLFGRAGLTPGDMDVVQLYDAYTPMVITKLEDYGFCKKGEGGPFVEGGRIEVGGELPVNTSGGLLSEGYLQGMNHIAEGVRQLRGTSTAQVRDAEFCFVDSGSPFGAIILRR